MKRGTLILSGLLAGQLALAGILALTGSDYGAHDATDPLIAFDTAKIDQIAIDQTGGNSVTLKKEDGKWVVPSFAGFPADATKVTLFLDKLRELKKGFPVATSSDAAARFKVSDRVNERRIVLSSGGKEAAKLLLGTSPSFRLANVRSGASDEIYSVALSAYEAPVRGEDWMDREALAIPADQVSSVTFPDGVTLERKDGKFALAGVKDGEKVIDSKVQSAGGAALRPAFDVIQGKGAEEVAKLGNPDFQFEVKKTDGTSRTYKYKKEAAGGAYLFVSSDRDYVFRVAEASVAVLVDAKRDKLIEAPAKPAEPAASPPPPAQPAPKTEAAPQVTPAPQASPAPQTQTPPPATSGQADTPAPSTPAAQADTPAPANSGAQADTPAPSSPAAQADTPPPANSGAQADTPPASNPAAQADTPPPATSGAQADTPPPGSPAAQADTTPPTAPAGGG